MQGIGLILSVLIFSYCPAGSGCPTPPGLYRRL